MCSRLATRGILPASKVRGSAIWARTQAFSYSYAHKNTKWLKELDRHLKGLELYAKVERFDDRKLVGGDAWDAEVKASLERADIILRLVTANFIGSDYIHRVELPAALKRRQDNGSILIPVLVQDCYRRLLAIDDINYLPKDPNGALKPLAKWRSPERDSGLRQVIEHVHVQIERIRARGKQQVEAAPVSGIDLSLYRRRAQQKWSAIDLSALAAPGAVDADVTIRLADVFVPQLARRSRPAASLPRDYLERQGLDPAAEAAQMEQIADTWERLTPVSALELAAEYRQRHLVLLGDPGAGKSVLARYVLLQLLNDAAPTGSPLSRIVCRSWLSCATSSCARQRAVAPISWAIWPTAVASSASASRPDPSNCNSPSGRRCSSSTGLTRSSILSGAD